MVTAVVGRSVEWLSRGMCRMVVFFVSFLHVDGRNERTNEQTHERNPLHQTSLLPVFCCVCMWTSSFVVTDNHSFIHSLID